MKRKIAAILAADIAGYSRLIAEDEEETLRRLTNYQNVFKDIIIEAGGRIFMGSAEANGEVIRPAWFDTAKFPQAKFVSSSVKSAAGGKFEMRGKLTIKGATKDVVVPFTVKEAAGLTVAEGAIDIKRLDFKVGDGVWDDLETVANEVQIRFLLTFSGAVAK